MDTKHAWKNTISRQAYELNKSSKTHLYTIHHWSQWWDIGATPRSSKNRLQTLKAMSEEPRWKVLCSYNEGVYIAMEDHWPLWLFDFPDSCLTSYDFSTDVTLQLHMCVSWTFILHYIWLQQVWPIVVMWPRQLMTLLTCTGWLWCSCQAVVLLSDSCALNVTFLHLCMEKCTGSSMVFVFVWWCMCMCPFRSLLDVLGVFIQLRASLLGCTPSSSC